jgi:hypothetical protein
MDEDWGTAVALLSRSRRMPNGGPVRDGVRRMVEARCPEALVS